MKTEITIKVEPLIVFNSFDHWVNKATTNLGGFPRTEKVICIDKNGNACNTGSDFMYARDHDLFPVKGYRLIKSGEDQKNNKKESDKTPTELLLSFIIDQEKDLSEYESFYTLLPKKFLVRKTDQGNRDFTKELVDMIIDWEKGLKLSSLEKAIKNSFVIEPM